MEKEYIEVFADNKSAKLIDFKELRIFEGTKTRRIKLGKQDKGQADEIKYFFDLIRGTIQEDSYFEDIYIGSLATFKILESLRKGQPVAIES
jgi:polar amino acid transport system substrate-binding protein